LEIQIVVHLPQHVLNSHQQNLFIL